MSTMLSPLPQSCDFRLAYDLLHIDYSGPKVLPAQRESYSASHIPHVFTVPGSAADMGEKGEALPHWAPLLWRVLNCGSHSITHKQNWGRNWVSFLPSFP